MTNLSTSKLDDRLSKILMYFKGRPLENLLDVGCGTGECTLLLKELTEAKQVYGIDISSLKLDEADRKGIKTLKLDVSTQRIPFPDGFFDAVFCGEVIEHLYNPDNLLQEIHRVLNDNGFAVITTPNLASWYNRGLILLGYQPFYCSSTSTVFDVGKPFKNNSIRGGTDGGEHIRAFTVRGLVQLLRLYGFRVTRISGATLDTPKRMPFALARLAWILEKLFTKAPSLATDIIIRVEK